MLALRLCVIRELHWPCTYVRSCVIRVGLWLRDSWWVCGRVIRVRLNSGCVFRAVLVVM